MMDVDPIQFAPLHAEDPSISNNISEVTAEIARLESTFLGNELDSFIQFLFISKKS